jgi:hypothetical protein
MGSGTSDLDADGQPSSKHITMYGTISASENDCVDNVDSCANKQRLRMRSAGNQQNRASARRAYLAGVHAHEHSKHLFWHEANEIDKTLPQYFPVLIEFQLIFTVLHKPEVFRKPDGYAQLQT